MSNTTGRRLIGALGLSLLAGIYLYAQDVTITIDATENKQEVSPNIYGNNNSFDKPATFYKDAGLRFVRMNGGNNATKYNWRQKISSHPDWYNNVYANDWDATSEQIATNHPDMQVMWAFQLLGRVASSTEHNFNDWEYNNSQWWEGVTQNLAGGGVPNEADPGGDAMVEGDVELYTMEWPADSTVAILDHWFGEEGIGLSKDQFLYWSMDNEPDIWNGTHDDVMSDGLIPASEFMDRFIEVATKAREKYPDIKICGPVTTSEWQWFKWGDESIVIEGQYYCWFEYFIKRLAEEEEATGVKLLDVFDIHNYPYSPTAADALQNHRIYYDTGYDYPGANGLKTINGGWDNSLTKEYIFKRINDWLNGYFGENHGITLGLSEWGPSSSDPNVASVAYASLLGTFANNGVEFFTPWIWETGMWETLHLFSRYSHKYSVSSISSAENMVSAYTTVNEASDSLTVIIVNRDQNSARNVRIDLTSFTLQDGVYKTLGLSSLPSTETFVSHTENALRESSVNVNANSFSITVPALSTTAVLFPSEGVVDGVEILSTATLDVQLFPNPVTRQINLTVGEAVSGTMEVAVLDMGGRNILSETHMHVNAPISIDMSDFAQGFYFISVKTDQGMALKKFSLLR